MDIKSNFALKEDQASSEEIRIRVENGVKVTGTNMYILIFAILIACIGLNMNSTAIVIGAMLISPLMGTIISIAYGFANNDLSWIRKSFMAFAFQVVVGIVASTIYFVISPINVFSGELAARTNPTIWDVLIAIFGGGAAIVANTRKNIISNVIPGTAIATALMPPLCTIGYCLASQRWIPALGAIYLFSINAIFICLSALAGLHLMKVTKSRKMLATGKSRIALGILLTVMIVPSGLLAWQTVKQSSTTRNFNNFIKNEMQFENTQVVMSKMNQDNGTIEISLIGSALSDQDIVLLNASLDDYDLGNYQLDIIQSQVAIGVTEEELNQRLEENSLKFANEEMDETEILWDIYQEEEELKKAVSSEIMALVPGSTSAGAALMRDNLGEEKYLFVLVADEIPSKDEQNKLTSWLENRVGVKIDILYVEE